MFYDRFIELCNQKNIKPTPLVVGMGLSSSNVSQWKKGSTPRPEVLAKLADYFGVSVEYLLTGEQKEKPAHNVDELSDLKKQAHSLIDGISDEKLKEYMPALERILRGG